jgi:hypothetical protein
MGWDCSCHKGGKDAVFSAALLGSSLSFVNPREKIPVGMKRAA